jgi:hypothetical protein
MLAAIVVPGRQLGFIGPASCDGEAPLHDLDVEIDPDVLPMFLDRFDEMERWNSWLMGSPAMARRLRISSVSAGVNTALSL